MFTLRATAKFLKVLGPLPEPRRGSDRIERSRPHDRSRCTPTGTAATFAEVTLVDESSSGPLSGQESLPPGQRALAKLPRFGLDEFMRRRVEAPADFTLEIAGDVEQPLSLTSSEIFATRTEATSDLHCVTTWSVVDLRWSGRTFRSFWDDVLVPRAKPKAGAAYLRLTGLDGYMAVVPLEEALHDESFLADRLDDRSLGDHGAPLRLVLPRLYGYKSVKHVRRIEITIGRLRPSAGRFLGHPRGRTDLEERSGWGLGRIFRVFYRLLLPLFLWRARALTRGRRH